MPRSISEGFDDFLFKLKASSPESEAARRHRASIEACLRSNFGLNRFVRIGSFGNGTSISGFSDVDYLAGIPTAQLTRSSVYSLVKVRDALDTRFPLTGVRVNTPAVAVPFGTRRSETTEVVPADLVGEAHGFKVYEIADGEGGWMRVSPDAHNAYVAGVDERHGGRAKALIRYIKAWKYLRGAPISSFYLEMRVAKYADGEKVIIPDIDVARVLRELWDHQLASMQDPMGFSGYIQACKTEAQRADVLTTLALFTIGLASRLYWIPRAETKRRQDFFTSACNVGLTHEVSDGYYNNDFTGSIDRMAAQVFENSLFSKSIALRMAWTERTKVVVYVIAWLTCLMNRETDLGWAVAATQAIFSEQLLSKAIRVDWIRSQFEKTYEDMYRLFQSRPQPPEFAAQMLDTLSFYETTKANGGIVLSSKIFERLNPELSLEWDKVKATLRM